MSTFVLVHGAWHGAWCWHKVLPRLESAGHTVAALDLPAHGTDTTPVGEVTMDDHVERGGEVLEAQSDPAILVGHSTGGAVITQTAEAYTDEIDTLVYLTGFLLDDGEALLEYAEADEESVVTQSLVVDEEGGVATVEADALREAFYADCDDADVTLATSLLRPEPLAGLVTPMQTSDEGFGSLPRVYIGCEQDNAITPATQERMRKRLPCDDVRSIDSSHSPFLSAPEAVAEHLDGIA
ncbi:alpha/beta fold hydrolase [Halobellus ruber]|uniref:Alpha/beta fold hydrolase n=1 Tax=Halobellus ruber TaxID=2761102 RepID=A0A7J9SMZ0_9EURY|nr:alpha/beta fold hydrolase [Halobellus ruber]